jgi:ABC-type polysaccharide/polyol phosphate transport system ATPase subunit
MNKVELINVSKKYNIYDHPADRLKEILTRNRKCLHREYWALRDINLTFKSGDTTALIGPNGSGKSTLLQIIANILQPTSGTVSINGRITAILELGSGFQSEYTGRENAMLNGMILGISESEMRERMDSIAEFAEIGDFLDQPIKTYSSGMVVRLAFALCISVDPEILLVDEALAVGDERFREKCYKKITSLQAEGKTIIFVTHDMEALKQFCDYAVLLNLGRVLEQGPTKKIVPEYHKLMNPESNSQSAAFTIPSMIS